MPRNMHEGRSRGEITETVDGRKREYQEKTDALGQAAKDIGIEREVIKDMEQSVGTLDGVEGALISMRGAETASEGEFTDGGAALEKAQSEGEELEGELRERTDSTTGDAERIGQARGQLTSDASRCLMERAETQTREDIEFLRGEEERARESREATEPEYDQLRQVVFGNGG